jgi:hypothetical protein
VVLWIEQYERDLYSLNSADWLDLARSGRSQCDGRTQTD